MEKLRDLLEHDKTQLLPALEQAENPGDAIRVLEREIARLQAVSSQQTEGELTAGEMSFALQAARSALSFADSTGEVSVYEKAAAPASVRTGFLQGRGARAAGAVLCAAAVLFAAAAGGPSRPVLVLPLSLCLLAAGLFCIFYRDLFRKRDARAERGAGHAGSSLVFVRPDAQKLYHALLALLTLTDGRLEEVEAQQALLPAETETAAGNGYLPESEVRLLARLLEMLYDRKEDVQAREMTEEIRYYLHQKQIDVVDYSRESTRWFDVMPSMQKATLRPALVQDGVLLSRGLAVENN